MDELQIFLSNSASERITNYTDLAQRWKVHQTEAEQNGNQRLAKHCRKVYGVMLMRRNQAEEDFKRYNQ